MNDTSDEYDSDADPDFVPDPVELQQDSSEDETTENPIIMIEHGLEHQPKKKKTSDNRPKTSKTKPSTSSDQPLCIGASSRKQSRKSIKGTPNLQINVEQPSKNLIVKPLVESLEKMALHGKRSQTKIEIRFQLKM